jgi:hypothetical protein
MKNKFASSVDRRNMFYWQSDRPFTGQETVDIFLKRHKTFDAKLMSQAIYYGMKQFGKSDDEAKVIEIQDPIPSGSVNLVSKATLADGTKIILRAHPSGIPNGYFYVEKAATEAAAQLKVPVYKTFYIYDEKKEFDFDFMLIERLPGFNADKELTLKGDKLEKFTWQTGYNAFLINSIPTQKYGYFDNVVAKKEGNLIGIHVSWKDHIFAAFTENLKYLVDQKVITISQSH